MPQSYPLKYVEDKQGNKYLPITHVHAVRDSNGNTLDAILDNLQLAVAPVTSVNAKVGDVVEIAEGSKSMKVIKESLESLSANVGWVEVDAEKMSGKYIREVERKELPQDITESQIVEYYNRKL